MDLGGYTRNGFCVRYNRDNARDVDCCPDEQSTRRSEPTKQVKIKIIVATGRETWLNDFKKYLTIFQLFKLNNVIL